MTRKYPCITPAADFSIFKQAVTVVEPVSFSMFALWLLIAILASAVCCCVYLLLIVSISRQGEVALWVCGPPAMDSLSGGLGQNRFCLCSSDMSLLVLLYLHWCLSACLSYIIRAQQMPKQVRAEQLGNHPGNVVPLSSRIPHSLEYFNSCSDATWKIH